MRRWIKVSVAAAMVLGVAGYAAEPSVRDWMLAGSACGGALPRDVVERLTPDGAHLESEESRRTEALGSYECVLSVGGDEVRDSRLLEMEAHTRRDDRDRELFSAFPQDGFSAQYPLPGGLPGFVDQYGGIDLLLPCPGLGEDDEGRRAELLVRTWMGRDTLSGVPGAAYRAVVALANSASDELGCEGEPLAEYEGDAVPPRPGDEPRTVPVARAKGTTCAWAAGAGLPDSGGWRLAAGMNDAAPTGRCTLRGPAAGTGSGSDSVLTFVAWYGDWSNRLVFEDSAGGFRSMTATARCDGQAANFALGGSGDVPGVGAADRRRMLKRFAQDQVDRRDCSDLRFRF
ncbi:hypothetical protein [Streptomyces fructofermentans]|uniref:Secreted protein n=1 Tax=Streptomyces fructofermentans TaxID=152141 RepID=A0A918NAM6_9ACTN|nr:hypothetical protein [Streptomyces fructofermentans]GGX56607.1 hypothetical protein GCM10010515_25090 [Streptomyces fructofermentans]